MENIFNIDRGGGLSALELFDASTPEIFTPNVTLEDLPALQANEDASIDLASQREQLGLTLDSNVNADINMGLGELNNPNDGIADNFFNPSATSPMLDAVTNPIFNTLNNSNDSNIPNAQSTPTTTSKGSVVAQVTRYGFEGDKYQNHTATSKGSKYENIGNRSNKLRNGVSVALPPRTAKALGINLKAGEFVEANIGGKWQKFSVDDTTANHKNHRIDFFDPQGNKVKLDGSKIEIRKAR